MTNNSELPPHLQARYGIKQTRYRTIVFWIIIIGSVVATIGYTTFRTINPKIGGALTSFSVISDHQVNVQWRVVRPENQTTYCVLRAQDINRFDVGYATVEIVAGSESIEMMYNLNTSSKAVLAEILGCSNSPKMRVPPANFPPGVKIPLQDPPGVAPTP